MPITTKAEFNKCRNRVNPIVDEVDIDDYEGLSSYRKRQATKSRMDALETKRWLDSQTKEVWE